MKVFTHLVDTYLSIINQAKHLLIVCDENCKDQLAVLLNVNLSQIGAKTRLMTNRYDIYLEAQKHHLDTLFNDFDFSPLEDNSFDCIIYCVSKERPVTHHILNHLRSLISDSGTLLLGGKKDEGVKTYHDKLRKQLGFNGALKKHKDIYLSAMLSLEKTEKKLEDKNYCTLRKAVEIESKSYFSKPGIYGWNKVDKGSQFLIETLRSEGLSHFMSKVKTCLDLGCGYGYLSIQLLDQNITPALESLCLTDNNAAALIAAENNIATLEHASKVTALPSDCANTVKEKFDLIVCNPPFHQGFDTNKNLTLSFLNSALSHLAKNGRAIFVTNNFITFPSVSTLPFTSYLSVSKEEVEKNTHFKITQFTLKN